MIDILPILLVLACSIIGSFGSLFFKLGSKNFRFSLDIIRNWKLMLGFFLYGSSAIIYIIALRYGELSIIYPLVSISYVWILILSNVFLKEKITKLKILGVLCIMMGVVFMGVNA